MADRCSRPGRTVTLQLSDRPHLSLNDRDHWAVRRQMTEAWRDETALRAGAAAFGRHDQIHVQLEFHPGDRRRRDADNLVATLKPCIDGLVQAGVVLDDSPQFVTWGQPKIVGPDDAGDRQRRWLLTVSCRCDSSTEVAA